MRVYHVVTIKYPSSTHYSMEKIYCEQIKVDPHITIFYASKLYGVYILIYR